MVELIVRRKKAALHASTNSTRVTAEASTLKAKHQVATLHGSVS